MSKQIPTISVFCGGIEKIRRPTIGPNKRFIPFIFSEVYLYNNILL